MYMFTWGAEYMFRCMTPGPVHLGCKCICSPGVLTM